LRGDEHGLDGGIPEDPDLDVIRGVRDDGLVIGRAGLGSLRGPDVTQGADGLEARADREVLLSRRVRRISDMEREWRSDEGGKGK
jgi:hypothetical protein